MASSPAGLTSASDPDHHTPIIFVARITHRGGLLDRGAVHRTPAPEQHVIRRVLTDNLPLRVLLEAGMGHGDRPEFETVLLRERQERGNRFLTVWTVMKQQGDSLALELVDAPDLFPDVLDRNICARPIGSEQWKIPHKHGAVLRGSPSKAGGQERDLVGVRPIRQYVG